MIGYPSTLNDRADYEYVRANFPKSEWQKDFQNLLDTVYEWFNMGKLADGDEGVTDETHKVVEGGREEEKSERYQFEYKENPDARIFRLGYTVDEVKAILAGE